MEFTDWITAGIGFELGKNLLGIMLLLGIFVLVGLVFVGFVIADKFKK